jgi:hypothetical protein
MSSAARSAPPAFEFSTTNVEIATNGSASARAEAVRFGVLSKDGLAERLSAARLSAFCCQL